MSVLYNDNVSGLFFWKITDFERFSPLKRLTYVYLNTIRFSGTGGLYVSPLACYIGLDYEVLHLKCPNHLNGSVHVSPFTSY